MMMNGGERGKENEKEKHVGLCGIAQRLLGGDFDRRDFTLNLSDPNVGRLQRTNS